MVKIAGKEQSHQGVNPSKASGTNSNYLCSVAAADTIKAGSTEPLSNLSRTSLLFRGIRASVAERRQVLQQVISGSENR